MFENIYQGRKVLLTGHTGFKGSWLALWLQSMGAEVVGISLPPETVPSHWDMLGLGMESFNCDIRDEQKLRKTVERVNPDMVFHLAAQSLVRRSYRQPLDTWSINVMGTANLLEACRFASNLSAILVVTTDKCYENKEWVWGYREVDPLGGRDVYSASKAGTEFVAASYRSSFFNDSSGPMLATARAGNVIGGGDWSEDRLIPDLIRAMKAGKLLEIRSPTATRPWQHVLDCLSGYLLLGQKLLAGDNRCAEAWNFGPSLEGNRQVVEVLSMIKSGWPEVEWHTAESDTLHEAQLLHLDSSKSHQYLNWCPVWSFEEGVSATSEWYRGWLNKAELMSAEQLNAYIGLAEKRNLVWARKH